MSDFRKFWLTDSWPGRAAKSYDLTSTSALLVDPKGLGFEHENGYRKVGNRFVLVTKNRKQVPFEGTIVFTPPDAYIKYQEFIDFCLNKQIFLLYRPFDQTDYYKARGKYTETKTVTYGQPIGPVEVESTVFDYEKAICIEKIEKEELTKYGALEVKIKFVPTTPWYSYERYGTRAYSTTTENANTILFDCGAQMESPCELLIRGPATNPTWAQYAYDANGNSYTIASGRVFTILDANEWLLVDNRYSNIDYKGEPLNYRYIRVVNSSGVWTRNVQPYSDFSRERWLNIRPGLNRVSVWADSGSPTIQSIQVKCYYESV